VGTTVSYYFYSRVNMYYFLLYKDLWKRVYLSNGGFAGTRLDDITSRINLI